MTQYANSIRDEEHGGNARVEIIDGFAEVFPYLEALGIKSTQEDVCDSSEISTDTTVQGISNMLQFLKQLYWGPHGQ